MPRKKISLKDVNAKIKKAAASLPPPPPPDEVLTEEQLLEGLRPTQADLRVLDAVARGQTFGQTRDMLAAIRMKCEFTIRKPESKTGINGSPVSVTIKMLTPTGQQDTTVPLEGDAPTRPQFEVKDEELQ